MDEAAVGQLIGHLQGGGCIGLPFTKGVRPVNSFQGRKKWDKAISGGGDGICPREEQPEESPHAGKWMRNRPRGEEAEMRCVEVTRWSNWKEKLETLKPGETAGSWVSVFAGMRKRNEGDAASPGGSPPTHHTELQARGCCRAQRVSERPEGPGWPNAEAMSST